MAAPLPKRRGSSTPDRVLAIAFSASVHVAIVAGLLWQLRWRPVEETPQALQVEILRQPDEHRAANEKPLPTFRKPANISPSPPAQTSSPAPPVLIAPPEPAAPAVPQGLSQALRGSLACAHPEDYGLTLSEREDCQLRAARLARAGADGPHFGLSPEKQAAFAAEARREDFLQKPFLAERPKKGCKPTVTEHEAGMVGRAAPDWTASLACTIRF